LSGTIVLKIPTESQSFRAALTDATLRDRVLEWTTAAVTLDDAVYIPLRTDWMPNGTRRTADGVEVLLAGRWPPEIDAETGPRVSAAIFGRVWEIVCDASPTEENKDIATCGLSGVNEEQTENEAPEVAPVVIRIHATPVNHVDGWSWSHVVTEIRQWADIYPDPLPDPNDISEAEARALLKTIYQHPVVIAEFERRRMVAEATQREYRDARTIQYAIDVGVDLPDPTPPPVTQEFPCTDDGNGDRLVAQYRDAIRYCARRSTHGSSGPVHGGSATRPAGCWRLPSGSPGRSISRRRRPQTTGARKSGNGPSRRGCSRG
jgi:hypothetical protein